MEETDRAAILLVDDVPANLVALEAVLEDLDLRIECADSGEEALKKILNQDFALILLDVLMPGLNGYETAELVRNRDKSRHIPIIFLSAIDKDQAQLFRGYKAGAVDYVFKPVEPLILRSKVLVFIELHKRAQEIRRQADMEKRLLAENLEARVNQLRTEKALERSQNQQSMVIDALPIALYTAAQADGFRRRQIVAGAADRLCGHAGKNFADSPTFWIDRLHDDDRDAVIDALNNIGESGSFSIEYRWRCADDSYHWFSDRAIVSGKADGDEAGMFGIWMDITERRMLEQQLTHAQKMEAVGQMTGGIAHDFNNMLSVIIGSLDRAVPAVSDNERLQRRLEMALQAALSCADLTKRLLGFARRQSLEPRSIELGGQLSQLTGLLNRVVNDDIAIQIDSPDDLWPVYIDPSQLEAAIVNLAVNARDAMPKGGDLMISARNCTIDQPERAGLDLQSGDYVELKVADSGCGMPDEVREHAFEPFFTTKENGKGTGLGLSSIYGFVKQSSGTVTIDSKPGAGTRICLFLPRSKVAFRQSAAADSKRPDLKDHTVILVEDDNAVREITRSMLDELGCRTIEAANGAEGLATLKAETSVSVLITDYMMPGELNGPALAREAVKLYPDLPVLLISAHRGALESEPLPDRTAFLPKPYTSAQVSEALAALLGKSG